MHVCIRLYLCDVAAVYFCGCVAIWPRSLFVLGRKDTGGKGRGAAWCLSDSLPPASDLYSLNGLDGLVWAGFFALSKDYYWDTESDIIF